MKESQKGAHGGVCVIIQLTHTFLLSSVASGVGKGLRIIGARTNDEAVTKIRLRDAVIDTVLDQSSL